MMVMGCYIKFMESEMTNSISDTLQAHRKSERLKVNIFKESHCLN